MLSAGVILNTLDRSLTVRENLYFHCRYFRLGRVEAGRRADELLEQFRLADRAGADVAALSAGMAQRLMVARGTAHHPHILFLDEPTAASIHRAGSPSGRSSALCMAKGSVLLTTHHMEQADRLCDRVAIMGRGHLLHPAHGRSSATRGRWRTG
jgi:ABC-2 type transport system ATP-binding protein